jgi:hypothetical protein
MAVLSPLKRNFDQTSVALSTASLNMANIDLSSNKKALLVEYQLKFGLIRHEETKFLFFFVLALLFSVVALGITFWPSAASIPSGVRSYIYVANALISIVIVVYYIAIRKKFYNYALRIKSIADILGIEGYLWNNSYDVKKPSFVTLPRLTRL